MNEKRRTGVYYAEPFYGESLKREGYPEEHVASCMDNRLESNLFVGRMNCHKCNLVAEKLTWIQFCSPEYTWVNLIGVEGPLSICPDCNVQVEFICEVRN